MDQPNLASSGAAPADASNAKAGWLLGLVAVLVLAGLFVWRARVNTDPGFLGLVRDDAIYALAARAIANGQGYIDLALPKHPVVMRYPPGFPLLLVPFLAGAKSAVEQAMRIQWAPALAGAALVVLTYGYARRRRGLGVPWALGVAAWTGLNPMTTALASQVMADLPYAVAGLLAVWSMEAASVAAAPLAAWRGVGALVGAACLIRYAGVALIAACLGLLALRRDWRAAAGVCVGLALTLGPWLVYRQLYGGADYAATYLDHLPKGAIALAIAIVLLSTFANALPAMLAGALFPTGPSVLSVAPLVALGIGISIVVLWGTLPTLRRWRETPPPFAEAYIVTTLALTAVYAFAYTYYADNFLQRALVPIAPFMMLAAARGGAHLLREWGPASRRNLAAAALVAGLVANGWGVWREFQADVPGRWSGDAEYFRIFDAVRKLTKPTDVLIAQHSNMTTFYTDRPCIPILQVAIAPNAPPATVPAAMLVDMMKKEHVAYLVGTPFFAWGERDDRTVVVVNEIQHVAAGLLAPVYINPTHNFVLFAVDGARLAAIDPRKLEASPAPRATPAP